MMKRKQRLYPINRLLLAKRFQFQAKTTEANTVLRLNRLESKRVGDYFYNVDVDTDVHPYKFRIDKVFQMKQGTLTTVAVMEGEFYEEINMGVTFVKGVVYAGDAAALGWFFAGCFLISLLLVSLGIGPAMCGLVLMPIASIGGFANSLTGREAFVNFVERELSG
jgi:hypothetical protein